MNSLTAKDEGILVLPRVALPVRRCELSVVGLDRGVPTELAASTSTFAYTWNFRRNRGFSLYEEKHCQRLSTPQATEDCQASRLPGCSNKYSQGFLGRVSQPPSNYGALAGIPMPARVWLPSLQAARLL